MNLHGQINVACESRPGHPQPCHWIVLECGFHVKSLLLSSTVLNDENTYSNNVNCAKLHTTAVCNTRVV